MYDAAEVNHCVELAVSSDECKKQVQGTGGRTKDVHIREKMC